MNISMDEYHINFRDLPESIQSKIAATDGDYHSAVEKGCANDQEFKTLFDASWQIALAIKHWINS